MSAAAEAFLRIFGTLLAHSDPLQMEGWETNEDLCYNNLHLRVNLYQKPQLHCTLTLNPHRCFASSMFLQQTLIRSIGTKIEEEHITYNYYALEKIVYQQYNFSQMDHLQQRLKNQLMPNWSCICQKVEGSMHHHLFLYWAFVGRSRPPNFFSVCIMVFWSSFHF